MSNTVPVSGVVVSVDFGPYLAVTLPNNVWLFDETIVVTATDDTDTIAIAQKFGARVVISDRFWQHGDAFNRAAGLNDGLHAARWDNIYCFDADVILPGDAKEAMSHIDGETLYGLSRYTRKPGSENEWQLRGTAENYTVGYSQLFCRTASSFPGGYCEEFTSAGFSDIEFMFHWPKELRRKLTHTPCYHIGERKVAWYGLRQNPGISSPSIENSTPTFRLQEYPKTGILLVHRLDRNKQICQVSIETDAGLLDVGIFRPEDYHAISWAYHVPQATLHIYENSEEIINQQPIMRR